MKKQHLMVLPVLFLAASAAWAADDNQPSARPQAGALFAQADANKDGKLDNKEFADLQRLHEAEMAKRRPDFAALDQNGDGFVTQDELRASMKARHAERGAHKGHNRDALFTQADADKNGSLSEAEYQKLISLRQQRQAAMQAATPSFAALDTNKDGQLSREELQAGMRTMHKQRMEAAASAATPQQ